MFRNAKGHPYVNTHLYKVSTDLSTLVDCNMALLQLRRLFTGFPSSVQSQGSRWGIYGERIRLYTVYIHISGWCVNCISKHSVL